jgi:cephalosporin hydroxylase
MGGSALFYVAVAPKIKVLSIDTQEKFAPSVKHQRITFLKGSSTDPRIVKQVKAAATGQRVMVILDSDHEENHVFREMEIYSDLVSPKCYMVVEDTNLGGNPVVNTCVPGRGPMGAVERFMGKDDRFEIDKGREKFFMTFYPNGWLRRKDK